MRVATHDLPRSAGHPFYAGLNQILDKADFDGYVEGLCHRFYANEIGRPALPPGRYFRLLPIASDPVAQIGVRELAFTTGCWPAIPAPHLNPEP